MVMQLPSRRLALGVSVLALTAHAPAALAQSGAQANSLDELSEAAEKADMALETATAQENAGNLLGAAATLERALLKHPEADDVRIAYATLLCRLDNRQSAQVELGMLRSRPTSSAGWNRMLETCGEDFGQFTRRTGRINGQIRVGIAYDEDAFGELSTFTFLPPESTDGLAIVTTSQINARVPAGSAFFYGDLFAQTHNDISGPDSDYQFGDAAIGFGIENGASEFSVGGLVRHGRISGDKYLTAVGGEARASFRVGTKSRLTLRAEAVDEDFVTGLLDGWHYTGQIAYEVHPTLRSSIFVAATAETKSAEFKFLGYDAFGIAGAVEFPLSEGGTYAKLSSTLRRVNFQNEEFFEDRREWRLYLRGAVGVPLVGRSLYLEGAARYRSRENSQQFVDDYSSLGADLMLVWRF